MDSNAVHQDSRALNSGTRKLDLSHMRLSEVPAEVFQLTNLEVLYLHDNRLTALPPEIGQLTELKTLTLGTNLLVELPTEIGKLLNLNWLSLVNNKLVALPAEVGQLVGLKKELAVENNALTNLPPEIGNLVNLETLKLGINNLSELPGEMGRLRNLRALQVSRNRITSLPPEIGNLANLEILDLSFNELLKLPSTIGDLSSLKSLNLEKNKLSRLPSEIAQLSNLEAMHLQCNHLTALPSEIGQLVNLASLDLEANQLTSLPPEIGQLSRLKKLSVQNNQLTALPPEIGRLFNLESLYLKNNRLTALPTEIGGLASLQSLSLINNQLTKLPDSIGRLRNLKGLFLRPDQPFALPLTSRIREWDVFISHASEDKETVALPLARALIIAGLKVWIDQQELQLGDSIRSKIDLGLSKSRFGVVILSQSFIEKAWTQRELNGLMAIEDQGEKVILPVWHNISKAALTQYSPIMSDRLAANTSEGISVVASKIIDVVLYHAHASPSTLFPSLTRRFVQLIRDSGSTATNLRDFLSQHPRIIRRAFGKWGGAETLSSEFLNQNPAILAQYEGEATIKRVKALYLVLASPQVSPLMTETTAGVHADHGDSIVEIRSLVLNRPGKWHEAVIVAGRRQELSEDDKQRMNEFNEANKLVALSVRTYDWLIDACVSLDQEIGPR